MRAVTAQGKKRYLCAVTSFWYGMANLEIVIPKVINAKEFICAALPSLIISCLRLCVPHLNALPTLTKTVTLSLSISLLLLHILWLRNAPESRLALELRPTCCVQNRMHYFENIYFPTMLSDLAHFQYLTRFLLRYIFKVGDAHQWSKWVTQFDL